MHCTVLHLYSNDNNNDNDNNTAEIHRLLVEERYLLPDSKDANQSLRFYECSCYYYCCCCLLLSPWSDARAMPQWTLSTRTAAASETYTRAGHKATPRRQALPIPAVRLVNAGPIDPTDHEHSHSSDQRKEACFRLRLRSTPIVPLYTREIVDPRLPRQSRGSGGLFRHREPVVAGQRRQRRHTRARAARDTGAITTERDAVPRSFFIIIIIVVGNPQSQRIPADIQFVHATSKLVAAGPGWAICRQH